MEPPARSANDDQTGWTCRWTCFGREPTSTDVHQWESRARSQGGGKHGGERSEALPGSCNGRRELAGPTGLEPGGRHR